jgi:hypothetical protein
VDITKQFLTGITVAPSVEVVRTRNSPSLFDPVNNSTATLLVSVPVLKGAWTKAADANEMFAQKASEDSLVLRIPRAALLVKIDADQTFAARCYRSIAMFLSDRLRKLTAAVGHPDGKQVPEGVLEQDELDPNVLDTVAIAGSRFDRLPKKLRGQ